MKSPSPQEIYSAMEATWPPAGCQTVGPWTIRDGGGGGKRVSATTGDASSEIEAAEAAMTSLGQTHLFMIRQGSDALDQALAARSYNVIDPVSLYSCRIETLTNNPVPYQTGFTVWPPLAIMDEIWDAGGIGAERRAVMKRAKSTKSAIFGRTENRAAGCAFIAIHREIAMIHAMEVVPGLRRNGVGINIMRTAAHWAQNKGARYFALLVTDANIPANALYTKLGLSVVGHYHYRVRQKQQQDRGRT